MQTSELQAQIYNLKNQNYDYELRFKRMSIAASCRILETRVSFTDGNPIPWKQVAYEEDKASKN